MELENVAAIILAGGKGTRMKSQLPKMLHPVLNEPMIYHPLRASRLAGIPPERTIVVVGHGKTAMIEAVSRFGNYLFAEQPEQLGTGHAVMVAQETAQTLADVKHILVFYGDNALLHPRSLSQMLAKHLERQPLVTLATAHLQDPIGYGRIIRDEQTSRFKAIVEETDCSPEQKLVKEFNPGVYVFDAAWLWATLPKLQKSPRGEYYLTDVPALAIAENSAGVETLEIDAVETLGINDRVQLAEVSNILRQRVLRDLMLNGVTITDPATTYISAGVQIAPDSVIEPNTHLRGQTQIGTGCTIGPNSLLRDAQIGDNCQIIASVVEESVLEEAVKVGPFSRVRPGCHLERGAYMGNFAEVSRSHIGANSKQGHFSFIGDATLGEEVNVGAGTITANYDGINKNKSVIGSRVFLGSDTTLRAPIVLGDEARTGAGSVVTKNVEPGVTVVGLPARPIKRKKILDSINSTNNPNNSKEGTVEEVSEL